MSRFILIGHPVGHSLSPAIHRAAYECLGLTHEYELVDAPDKEAVLAEFEALREGRIHGANVTVPHKRLALALADRADTSAARVGAANVLARDEHGAIVAYNTDALGLARVLERLVRGAGLLPEAPVGVGGFAPGRALEAMVIGNGGAALACVVACQLLGVRKVLVSARSFDQTVPVEAWPHASEFLRLGAEPVPWLNSELGRSRVAGSTLLLQATSAGMQGKAGGQELAALIPWAALDSGSVAYDLVYNPALTPFLAEAGVHGLVREGGLSMLVAQAQLAIQIWLGTLPEAAPLARAASAALGATA